ncbi:caspase family protein [Nocardia salmonicida]|uniref:caspase, EACC1-associated type n=1 Tax=Nocardia salmonicida TaxID=53431 RepID=UPI002E2E62ED|nr:caspase family protein [Nocardia salmonicida]
MSLSSRGTRVLVVGSGAYVDGSPVPAVESAAASAQDLSAALLKHCGVRDENLVTLIDPTDAELVTGTLSDLADEATDVIVFYYVGHGLLSADNQLHLTTHASDHLTKLRRGSVPYSTVRQILAESGARSKVVMLDCCFGGRARGALGPEAAGGTYLLTAASARQQALAPEGETHTAFTGALINLINNGDSIEAGHLTLDSTFRHLSRKLPARGVPAPRRHASGTVNELVLTRNSAPRPAKRSTRDRAPSESDSPCPYRGLGPFTEADTRFFFGRSELVTDILDQLADFTTNPGLVIVTGTSGVGKSSVLQAGVLPAIARGDHDVAGSDGWTHTLLTPGPRPLERLATELADHSRRTDDDILATLRIEPTSIPSILDHSGNDSQASITQTVIVVDQFEEVFTDCDDPTERDAFITTLCCLADTAALVLVCLRADFYTQCLDYPPLIEALNDRQIVIGPMTEKQIRTAIEGPAFEAGLGLEHRLTDRLLHDQSRGHEISQASLPLLSYALELTWAQRDGSMLTLAGYEATGGIWEAVTRQADTAYDSLDADGKRGMQTLLTHMVHIGSHTDDTRRSLDLTAFLATDSDNTAGIIAARDTLVSLRLITVDSEGTAQLSHEALLRAWDKLRRWINRDRHTILVRQQLAIDAEQWDDAGRDESLLYRGVRLATIEAHAISAERAQPVTDFLTESFNSRQRDQHKRTLTRVGFALLLVLSLTVSIIAGIGFTNATTESDRANANAQKILVTSLITQSRAMLAGDYFGGDVRAFQQILAAHALSPGPETDMAIAHGLALHNRVAKIVELPIPATDISFSPDGARLATASNDKTVRLWDAHTLQPIGEPLTGHTGSVLSVAFSPDGTRLATASNDKTVRIWDARAGQPIGAPLIGHTDGVSDVAFSPDGTHLATDSGATVRIWDARTLQPIGEPLTGHTGSVSSVAFSPDGTRLATASSGTVRIWDARTFQPIGEPLIGHTDSGSSVAFSPDSTRLVTTNTATVRIWDARTLQPIGEPLTGHTDRISGVAFSPDGTRLATTSFDKTLRIWDARTFQPIGEPLIGHTDGVSGVAFSPDSTRIATTSNDKTVRIWDARAGQSIGEPLTGHTDLILGVAFSPDGTRLTTASNDKTVRIWDAGTFQPIGEQLTGQTGWRSSVAFSSDRTRLATASGTTVRIWDARTLQPIGETPTGYTDRILGVTFSPDGTRLATTSFDKTVRIWDARTLQPIGEPLIGHTDSGSRIALSRDGTRLATTSDAIVRIWDARTLQPIGEPLIGHTEQISGVAFSPDGTRLATTSFDKTVRIWDARTFQPIGEPLIGHTDGVSSIAFSPDSTRIATTSNDKTVRIWDARAGQPIGAPLTVAALVSSVAFSPDGTRLATTSADKSIRIWPSAAGNPALLCDKITMNMSLKEWARWISSNVPYMKLCPDLPIGPD